MTALLWVAPAVCALVVLAAGAVSMRVARISAARKRAELVESWVPQHRDRRRP